MRTVNRRGLPAAVAGCLLMALAGCSNSSGGSGGTTTPAGTRLTIQNFAFHPADLSVAPGATVTVTNADSTEHTVTATGTGHAFATGIIAAGRTVTFTAPKAGGTYAYDCTVHPFMKGTLTVR